MKKSKKKLTSNEDPEPEEPEIPPKKQKGLENSMNELNIGEGSMKRKKCDSNSTENLRICEKRAKIEEDSSSNDEGNFGNSIIIFFLLIIL